MQLGIAILLNDEAHNAVRRLQLEIAERWGPHPALKQTPHITVKQPFHAKVLAPVEAYFDGLVRVTAPVTIRMRDVEAFEADGVIFVAIEPNSALEALRRRVLRELHDQFGVKPRDIEDDRYRFHASLAFGLPPERFAEAWAALQNTRVDLEFKLETLGLFYYTGEDWIPYKRSKLPVA